MSSLQQYVPAAALLGLSSASILTGYITSFSTVTVPVIKSVPALSAQDQAKLWKTGFDLGRVTAPPLAIASAACFTFLAWQTHGIPGTLPVSPSTLYATAAVLAPSIVPFTILLMGPSTIAPLEAKAAGTASAPGDAETKALVEKWRGQNVYRAVMVGISAGLSAVAIWAQVV